MSELHDYGRFVIRLEQRQVLVDGQPVALGSRAFDVLRMLVERRERVVGKEELLELVWPGLIVEENNLQVQVSALRKLLGTQAIATIPGRGYQFTAAPASASVSAPLSSKLSGTAAAAARAATDPALVSNLLAPGDASGAGPRGHLLVADDNKVNRLLLTRTLQLLGHQVASVDNGRKALEFLRAQRHDLLLLDLEMPELDGFAVLEELARDPELHDLPVIVTSSLEGVEKVARCIELGADDYLHKPVNPVLLKARVSTSLERRRLREQQKALVQRLSAAAVPPARLTPLAQARGVVATVLAVSLRDAAATPSGATAEQLVDLLDSCHTLWRDALASHGGVMFDLRSDALMACFGTPLGRPGAEGPAEGNAPREVSPPTAAEARLAATRAALEMAEMMDIFNVERAVGGLPPLALRIGLASGEVVVGEVSAPPHTRWVCLGEPVRLALALQTFEEPLQGVGTLHRIWLDAATQSALRGRVATEQLTAQPGLVVTGAPGPAASQVFRAVSN